MIACALPELFRILVVMFQREVGDFFQVLRIQFHVRCSSRKTARPGGLEFCRARARRPKHLANCVFGWPPRQPNRNRLADEVSYSHRWILALSGYHGTRQEGNFISSCAAMKCGLASRKILTNAARVLPIRIDRHAL